MNKIVVVGVLACLLSIGACPASADDASSGKSGEIERGDISIRFSNAEFSDSIISMLSATNEVETISKRMTDAIAAQYGRMKNGGNAPEATVRVLLSEVRKMSGRSTPSPQLMVQTVTKQLDTFRADIYVDPDMPGRPVQLIVLVVNFDPIALGRKVRPVMEQDMRRLMGEDQFMELQERIIDRRSTDGHQFIMIKDRSRRREAEQVMEPIDGPRRENNGYIAATKLDIDDKYAIVMGNDEDRVLDLVDLYSREGSELIDSKTDGVIISYDMNGELLSQDDGPRDIVEQFGFDPDDFLDAAWLEVINGKESTTIAVTFDMNNAEDTEPLKGLLTSFIAMTQLTGLPMAGDSENAEILMQLIQQIDVSVSKNRVTARLAIEDDEMLPLLLNMMKNSRVGGNRIHVR